MNAGHAGPGVVLVGLMGTGKSSVAKLVGEATGLDVFDTDRMVEEAAGKKVRDVFAHDGEKRFREMETEQLVRCLAMPVPCVVAAAGGVVLSAENREALRRARVSGRTMVVWLTADTPTLLARTRRGAHRPLLDEGPEETLRSMADSRRELYASVSDVKVDTSEMTTRQVADRILAELDRARAGGGSKALDRTRGDETVEREPWIQ